jgi:hypothetical protein
MMNMAAVLQDQGKHAEALALHEQALSGLRSALGDAHPDTRACMASMHVSASRSDGSVASSVEHRTPAEGGVAIGAATAPESLLEAVRAGDAVAVESYDGRIDVQGAGNVTVVQLALQLKPAESRLAMLRVLRAKGADLNAPFGDHGALPVVYAASHVDVDVETLAWLVRDGGVDVNRRSGDNVSALHAAVDARDDGKVAVLLSREDLDVEAVDSFGQTALDIAKSLEMDSVVDLIERRRGGATVRRVALRCGCRVCWR